MLPLHLPSITFSAVHPTFGDHLRRPSFHAGDLPPGRPHPASLELATMLGVHRRTTVAKRLLRVESEGPDSGAMWDAHVHQGNGNGLNITARAPVLNGNGGIRLGTPARRP